MKKLFNLPFAMLLCMAMSVMFTACEKETEAPTLRFTSATGDIANGSTYVSNEIDPQFAAMGINRFIPTLGIWGEEDGQITVTVKSLNETAIEFCMFGGCKIATSYNNYTMSATGSVHSAYPTPLDIHYTPVTSDGTHRAEALITAYYEGYETEAVSFKLVMTNAKEE